MLASGILPDDTIAFLIQTSSRGNKSIFQGLELGANDIALMADSSEYLFRSPENLRMMIATIPVSRVSRALCAATYRKDLRHLVAKTSAISLDNRSLVGLIKAIRHTLDITQSAPPPAELTVGLLELEEYIITTLSLAISCAPEHLRKSPLARKNRLRYLERARAYIDAHPNAPLGMETLTTVTGTSIRSLETAFREVLGLTPVQYIKVKRLNVAKTRLLHAERTETSVTATALLLGFTHMSRFAGDYQTLFGELPSATLGASA